jgi:hypothetical protein
MRPRGQDFAAFLSLGLGAAIIVYVLTMTGCRTNVPAIDAKFWAGDSAKSGITRAQENRTLACENPEFDEYVCLSYEDLKKIYSTLLQCKDWGNIQLMSSRQAKKYYKKNKQVLDYVLYENSNKMESSHR